MRVLPLAGREEYEPPRLAISVAEQVGGLGMAHIW